MSRPPRSAQSPSSSGRLLHVSHQPAPANDRLPLLSQQQCRSNDRLPLLSQKQCRSNAPSLLASRQAVAPSGARPARGFTLVEVLVATALMLILLAVVVRIFAKVGSSVADARATLEMTDHLRATAARLQKDLAGLTVITIPPRSPASNEGYLEITEGPVGPVPLPAVAPVLARDTDKTRPTDATDPVPYEIDTTVRDFDDILMFTTHSLGQPFVGRFGTGSIQSDVAEVAWFVRGTTLYRRVLLVVPGVNLSGATADGFYADYDISVRLENGALKANTLGDLTKRECRFAHQSPGGFPFHPHISVDWSHTPPVTRTDWARLGLPTLRECSHTNWRAGDVLPQITLNAKGVLDAWRNPYPWNQLDPETGTLNSYPGPRIAEDVILTNVIGFDVKVWDPGAPVVSDGNDTWSPSDPGYQSSLPTVSYGAYVDLGYLNDDYESPTYVPAAGAPMPLFYHRGAGRSGLEAEVNEPECRVYDTWSTHYENDDIDQFNDGTKDLGTNGFDDNGDGVVDDPGEMDTLPPYPAPLRGIQVKIRVFEPDSRQIREVTVVQDFLAK